MKYLFVFSAFYVVTHFCHAQELDENLDRPLKIEANYNVQRLKSYSIEVNNNKVYDDERERGLAEFLEDQEKWDLVRERGLQEYRKQKKVGSPTESGPEYLEFLEEKESQEARYERSRKIQVQTRVEVSSENSSQEIANLESDALGLLVKRPRYDVRKRSFNRWAKKNGTVGSSGSGYNGGGFGGSGQTFDNQPSIPTNEFIPTPEFPPAPAPFEVPDENQYVPPPSFDPSTGMPYDGGDVSIPPPPPPPTDFDF